MSKIKTNLEYKEATITLFTTFKSYDDLMTHKHVRITKHKAGDLMSIHNSTTRVDDISEAVVYVSGYPIDLRHIVVSNGEQWLCVSNGGRKAFVRLDNAINVLPT